MNPRTVAAAVLIVAGAWYYNRMRTSSQAVAVNDDVGSVADSVLTSATQNTLQFVDELSGGFMKVSAMARVDPALLNNRNVQAILRVIRAGEGTADDGGYSRLYGGAQFSGYADHPRQSIRKWGITSTAAGAYQFLSRTWDETRRIMNLPDFSPRSQDLGALGRIAARGALEDVLAGRFTTAMRKLNKEWASLPGSPYGQKTMRFDAALAVYQGNGGMQVEQTALA